MSTAQVSIELVLAGILALCAFVLPFFTGRHLENTLLKDNVWVAVLALAYLIGVVFDKLADTIHSPFEHYLRLRQADEYLTLNPTSKEVDAFPQSMLEGYLRKLKDGRLDWMDSLKSRVRTSRELAILGMPATTGIAFYLVKVNASERWVYAFVIANLFLFAASIWIDLRRPTKITFQKPKEEKLRTDNLKRDRQERAEQLKRAEKQMHTNASVYYLILANSSAAIITLVLQNPANTAVLLSGAGGLIVTMLAFWTSLRITRTYLRTVADAMGEYIAQKTKR